MNQKSTQAPVIMVCMIRHGERCDKSIDDNERERALSNPHDPPLSELGISQAHVCGQKQREYLQKGGYTNIIIETSPFLRCL